jgi:hypothetical protein
MFDWLESLIGKNNQAPIDNQFAKKELEMHQRIDAKLDAARKEIWDAYGKALSIIRWIFVVAVGIGTVLVGKTCSEMRQNARAVANEEIEKVRLQIKDQLREEFKAERIQLTINEAAKEQVRLQAIPLIQSDISSRIEPMETRLAASLAESATTATSLSNAVRNAELKQDAQMTEYNVKANELRSLISDANTALERLKVESDFLTTTILADHDDRDAYETLANIAHDKNDERSSRAWAVINRIALDYGNALRSRIVVNWDTNSIATNRHTWGMDIIGHVWNEMTFDNAADFIVFVGAHTNITKEQKLSFFRKVYLKDSKRSLHAQHEAAKLAAKELGANYRFPFQFGDIENFWKEFTATNHLFDVTNNSDEEMKYQVMRSTDTNRVIIIPQGEKKCVIFVLDAPAERTPIRGKAFGYSNSIIYDLPMNDVYGHLATTRIIGWNGIDEIKFEIMYKPHSDARDESIKVTPDVVDENGKFVPSAFLR